MRVFLMLLCISTTLPGALCAQKNPAVPEFEVGRRVRVFPVEAEAGRLSGRLLGLTPDSLQFQSSDTDRPQTVALSALQRVEQSEGRNRLLGAAVGLLVGAASGVIIARIVVEEEPEDIGGLGSAAEGAGITLISAAVGGAVGFFVAPERWRTIWQR